MEDSLVVDNKNYNNKYDSEWVQLLLEAKNLGITQEEIRIFLQMKKSEMKVLDH